MQYKWLGLSKCSFVCGLTVFVLGLSGCVVLPKKDYSEKLECGLSSDKKVLRIVNLTDGDTSFYRWSDEMVAFITIPASAIVSGAYVLVNNIYHIGEKTIKCGNHSKTKSDQQQEVREPNQPEKTAQQ